MYTKLELDEINKLTRIIELLKEDSFNAFFEEIIFMNVYHKLFKFKDKSLYFFISYENDSCNVVVTDVKVLKEDIFLELKFDADVCSYIEKNIEYKFFSDTSIVGAYNVNLFEKFIVAKYNLNDLSDLSDYKNIEQLNAWNREFVCEKFELERNLIALEKVSYGKEKFNEYIDQLEERLIMMKSNGLKLVNY